MRHTDTDLLVLQTLLRTLGTLLLIQAGRIEVYDSGFVIDLSADIQRLRATITALEAQLSTKH